MAAAPPARVLSSRPTDAGASASASAGAAVGGAPKPLAAPAVAASSENARPAGAGVFELRLRHAYCATDWPAHSVIYLQPSSVVVPVGRHLWRFDTQKLTMDFFAKRQLTGHCQLVTSRDGSALAVAETAAEDGAHDAHRAQMSIFELPGPRLTWKITHPFEGQVAAAAFSADSKLVACVVGKPRSQSAPNGSSALTIWKRDIKKTLASREIHHRVLHATFNPSDSFLLCAAGENYLRLLKLVGNSIEEMPLVRKPLERKYYFGQHVWLSDHTLAVLTDTPAFLLISNGEVVQTVARDSGLDASGQPLCVASWRSGLLVGTSDGRLAIYTFDPAAQRCEVWKVFTADARGRGVIDIAVSPQSHQVTCTVKGLGLLAFDLHLVGRWNDTELSFREVLLPFDMMPTLDVSEQKSQLISIGNDSMLRLWDQIRTSNVVSRCRAAQTFTSTPQCLALHPNGMQLLVGFFDRITLFHVLRDSVHKSFDLHLPTPILKPLLIRYSHGGHMFVVTSATRVYLYDSTTLCLLRSFSGNVGAVREVTWSCEDTVLATASADGAVYAWNIFTEQRVMDHVDKRMEYSALAIDWGHHWMQMDDVGPAYDSAVALAIATTTAAGSGAGAAASGAAAAAAAAAQNSQSSAAQQYAQLAAVLRKSAKDAGAVNDGMTGVMVVAGEGRQSYKLEVLLCDGTALECVSDGVDLAKTAISKLVLDADRKVLLAGTRDGSVLMFAWPFAFSAKGPHMAMLTLCGQYSIHAGPLTDLRFLPASMMLFTAGADGHLFVLDLVAPFGSAGGLGGALGGASLTVGGTGTVGVGLGGAGGAGALLSSSSTWISHSARILARFDGAFVGDHDVVMVERSEWESTMEATLSHRAELLKLRKESKAAIKYTKDQCTDELRQLREEMEKLMQQHDSEVAALKRQLAEKDAELSRSSQRASATLQEKVSQVQEKLETRIQQSDDRYDTKCAELFDLQRKSEAAITELKETHRRERAHKDREHATRVAELEQQIAVLQKQLADQSRTYESALLQQEGEMDGKLAEAATSIKSAEDQHKQTQAQLSAELRTMKRKLDDSQARLSDTEIHVGELELELKRLRSQNQDLKEELQFAKRRAKECEKEVSGRQQELTKSHKDNAVLQNFQRLLQDRIHELEKREDPALNQLRSMAQKMRTMDDELVEGQRRYRELQKDFAVKKNEVGAAIAEADKLRGQLAALEDTLRTVKNQIGAVVEESDPVEWGKGLLHIYQQHVQGPKPQTMRDSAPSPAPTSSPRGRKHKSGPGGREASKKGGACNGAKPRSRSSNATGRTVRALEEQRNHLEKKIHILDQQHETQTQRFKHEYEQVLAQNVLLLQELNELREEKAKIGALARSLQMQLSQASGRLEQEQKQHRATAAASASQVAAGDESQSPAFAKARRTVQSAAASPTAAQLRSSASHADLILESRRALKTSRRPGMAARDRLLARSNSVAEAGRLFLGSTRPLTAVSKMQHSMQQMQRDLEQATETMRRQQIEILRLQDGVQSALQTTTAPSSPTN